MNRNIRKPLLCLAALAVSGSALADGTAPCGISTNVLANGTVELSNTGSVAKCEPPAATPASVPAATPSAPAKASSSANDAAPNNTATAAPEPSAPPAADSQAASDQAKDPRESYKEAMLQGAPGTTAANPAVSRRYKMMDKATYRATVLSGGSQGSQADSPASSTPAQ